MKTRTLRMRKVPAVYWAGAESTGAFLKRITTPRGRVLDLGTGSGVLAIQAAITADHVTATDSEFRAVGEAILNAEANGVYGIDFRTICDYEGLGMFDHIIGQPPFLPTAGAHGAAFADGGPTGTEVLTRWIAGAPDHLRVGGIAEFLGVLDRMPTLPDDISSEVEDIDQAPHGRYVFVRLRKED